LNRQPHPVDDGVVLHEPVEPWHEGVCATPAVGNQIATAAIGRALERFIGVLLTE